MEMLLYWLLIFLVEIDIIILNKLGFGRISCNIIFYIIQKKSLLTNSHKHFFLSYIVKRFEFYLPEKVQVEVCQMVVIVH